MAYQFQLRVPTENVEQGIENRLAALADLRDFYNLVARPILIRDIQEIFERQGSPPWQLRKPTTPPTTHPLLRRSGRLYNSLTKPGGENISIATKDTFTFGTSVPYARYLEGGTKRMPARPILGTVAKGKRGARKSVRTLLSQALLNYLNAHQRRG